MVALNKETVAVSLLDDDPSILKATSRLLDSVGWKVETFTDPFAFLEHASIALSRRCSDRYPHAGDERTGGANAVARRFAFDTSDCADRQRRSVSSSDGYERRRFCFFHQRRGKRRISRGSKGCGRFLSISFRVAVRKALRLKSHRLLFAFAARCSPLAHNSKQRIK